MKLQRLKKSRKYPEPGDVFTYSLSGMYGFGRVISTTAVIGGFPEAILIYLYRVFAKSQCEVPALSVTHLLIPPCGVGPTIWRQGYFETVAHKLLTSQDILPEHCFYDDIYDCYRDEFGKRRKTRAEPCGFGVLNRIEAVEYDIVAAMRVKNNNAEL